MREFNLSVLGLTIISLTLLGLGRMCIPATQAQAPSTQNSAPADSIKDAIDPIWPTSHQEKIPWHNTRSDVYLVENDYALQPVEINASAKPANDVAYGTSGPAYDTYTIEQIAYMATQSPLTTVTHYTQAITNGNFEDSGLMSLWNYSTIAERVTRTSVPHYLGPGQSFSMLLPDTLVSGVPRNPWLSQEIEMPAWVITPTIYGGTQLILKLHVGINPEGSAEPDELYVDLRTSGQAVFPVTPPITVATGADLPALDPVDYTNEDWITKTINLADYFNPAIYRNQPLILYFYAPNDGGTDSTRFYLDNITLEIFNVGILLTGLSINGPTAGLVNTPATFTATVSPVSATNPITYHWQASGQNPITHTAGLSDTVTFNWAGRGMQAITLTASNIVGAVIDTHRIILGASLTGDAYEPDDTCFTAQPIQIDDVGQSHTFHQADDEDWVSFQATAGITYVIRASVPPASVANLNLELYGECNSVPTGYDPAFSADLQVTFVAPTSSQYHLRLTNKEPNIFGPGVTYDLTVRKVEETQPGALILVAGRIRADDELQRNIYQVTNSLYHFARQHGCGPDQIFYLAPDMMPNGDNEVNVDRLATRQNLEYALTVWAKDKVSADSPLTVYMMDHGGVDQLYLDKPQGEWFTPADLNGWLDTLETEAPLTPVPVNVVIEACNSGSFIDPEQRVSKPGRVVIASTGATALAYASGEGALFSDAFLNTLGQGVSLAEAFQESMWAVKQANAFQTPWLDDDGDGQPNEVEDGLLAAKRTFACTQLPPAPLWPPDLVEAAVGPISQGQGQIRLTVTDDIAVNRAWAVIYPPSYEVPLPGEEMVVPPLPPFALYNQGEDMWSGVYTQFIEAGLYRIVLYAEDSDGLQGRPQELSFEVRTIYLPLIQK